MTKDTHEKGNGEDIMDVVGESMHQPIVDLTYFDDSPGLRGKIISTELGNQEGINFVLFNIDITEAPKQLWNARGKAVLRIYNFKSGLHSYFDLQGTLGREVSFQRAHNLFNTLSPSVRKTIEDHFGLTQNEKYQNASTSINDLISFVKKGVAYIKSKFH